MKAPDPGFSPDDYRLAESRYFEDFTVGDRFPSLQDEDGTHLPADVEFGFRGGELTLLQIRPFVESRGAQQSGYLSQLDAAFRQRGAKRVDLKAIPREPNR